MRTVHNRPVNQRPNLPVSKDSAVFSNRPQKVGSVRKGVRFLNCAISNGQTENGTVGVVVVDHGSKRKTANDVLDVVVDMLKERTGKKIVEPAHMEIVEPTIPDAIRRCADQGAQTVIVTPYFLSNGRHVQEDIPRIVKEAQEEVPDIKCIVAEPLGLDPGLIEILDRRVDQALNGGGDQ